MTYQPTIVKRVGCVRHSWRSNLPDGYLYCTRCGETRAILKVDWTYSVSNGRLYNRVRAIQFGKRGYHPAKDPMRWFK